jgi:hypothetical protein
MISNGNKEGTPFCRSKDPEMAFKLQTARPASIPCLVAQSFALNNLLSPSKANSMLKKSRVVSDPEGYGKDIKSWWGSEV